MNELLDILIDRACKNIIEELKSQNVTQKQIENALEKKILSKVKKKKKSSSNKLVRTVLYISDSSEDEYE